MPRIGFAIDNRVCIGCHACTVACKSEHSVPIGVNRTWVKYIEKGTFPDTRRHFSVQRCNHCADAPCVEICPVTALYTRPDGIVDFDNDRCIGCKACMQACPYDALYLDPQTNTAAKCNYCTHRVDAGYEPACVVVCPVEAIVSGDLDDPNSRIARLDRLQKVQYPRPEKGTQPKLFYVGGEAAALDPTAAPPVTTYLWSGNDGSINARSLGQAGEESEAEARARRVYDAKAKPAPWGWMVSAYISTKAITAGVPIVAAGLYALGLSSRVLPHLAALVSLIFLAITGILLVGDLKRPDRFLYVLLRPQWRSWLVRGAYLITAFGLLLPMTWIASAVDASRSVQLALGWLLAGLGALVAAYTALLLAQARGRDYWQNPLLIVVMLAAAKLLAIVAGLVALTWLGSLGAAGLTWPQARMSLGVGVGALSGLLLAEFAMKHQTRNAELTARLITRGPFRWLFALGVVGLGLIAPLALLIYDSSINAAAALALLGIICKNHVLVQAPQRVPLS